MRSPQEIPEITRTIELGFLEFVAGHATEYGYEVVRDAHPNPHGCSITLRNRVGVEFILEVETWGSRTVNRDQADDPGLSQPLVDSALELAGEPKQCILVALRRLEVELGELIEYAQGEYESVASLALSELRACLRGARDEIEAS